MKGDIDIIIFSNPKALEHESNLVTKMFDEGLEYFHLRKPNFSKKQMMAFIESIPQKYRNRIIIHSHHFLAVNYGLRGIHLTRIHRKRKLITAIKCKWIKIMRPDIAITASHHSLSKLFNGNKHYSYVFLSPVFNSISKTEYKAAYKESSLKEKLKKSNQRIMALGGLSLFNVEKAIELGFKGVAFLGAIWESEDPLAYFRKIKKKTSRSNWEVKTIIKKVSTEK